MGCCDVTYTTILVDEEVDVFDEISDSTEAWIVYLKNVLRARYPDRPFIMDCCADMTDSEYVISRLKRVLDLYGFKMKHIFNAWNTDNILSLDNFNETVTEHTERQDLPDTPLDGFEYVSMIEDKNRDTSRSDGIKAVSTMELIDSIPNIGLQMTEYFIPLFYVYQKRSCC